MSSEIKELPSLRETDRWECVIEFRGNLLINNELG